ncbi:MAG TPA: type II toxin-antitoxin system VapB family antitoxin [Sporichthyaceae bacterium]|nr:type II toxin-antitoxin system VapB family antitoxin [Sporichthyaceae bacterium]
MSRRTTIETDDVLLAAAAEALGTVGLRETVHRALDTVVRAERRKRLAQRLRSGEGIDRSPEVLAAARAWRTD